MILKEYNLSVRLPQEKAIDTGITLVQNDKDVYKLNVRIFDGVNEIDYSEVDSATITFLKRDNNVVQGDMQVEADKLTYVLGTNEIASPGKLLVSIQLWGATERLSTARFVMQVERDLITDDAVESTSEFPILQRVKQDVDAIVPLLPDIEQTVQEMPAIRSFFDTAVVSETQRISNEVTRQSQEAARQARMTDIEDRFEELSAQQQQEANARMTDIEERFEELTAQQQQDAEVIDARMGKASLRANLESMNAALAEHQADMATLRFSTENTDYGNIFSVNPATVQGAMKGKLKGRTVQSLLKKDSFTNTANWSTYNSNLAISNNVLQVTGAGSTESFSRVYQITEYKPISGSSIFVKGYVRVTNSVCNSLLLLVRDGTGAVIQSLTIKNAPAQNTWYEFMYIVPISVALANNLNFIFQQSYTDAATCTGKVMEVRDVVAINITAEGLTDKTVDELNAMFPGYIDGMQSVQPQEIKSVGKNLFSEQWRQGDISGSSDIRVSTDSPVYVEKGKTYKVTSNSTSNYQVSFGFCLSRGGAVVQTATWNVTEFIPDNDSWAYPVIRNAGGTAFTVQELINSGYKLQIEEGTTATTYEPYQESKAYLKYPLRSVPNGVADEVDLQSGKLTKRCEEYVLQSADITGINTSFSSFDVVTINRNVLNGIYTQQSGVTQDKIYVEGFIKYLGSIGIDSTEYVGTFADTSSFSVNIVLLVAKGTYANLAAAQAALAGIKIVYQLAEPEVVEDALSNQLTVYPSGTVYTQPYEAELEESTIPIIEHSEPINLAGAVKSESDRNTRQDSQISDITLLLDYLIVVNA